MKLTFLDILAIIVFISVLLGIPEALINCLFFVS